MVQKILNFILKKEVIGPIIVIIFSTILYKVVKKLLRKFIDLKSHKLDTKRRNTLFYLFKSIVQKELFR